MSTLTVTAKGQITLKRDLLRHMGIGPGEKLTVEPRPGGRLSIAAVRPPRTGRMSAAFGMAAREGQKALTIEEMNEFIADGWAGRL